jgi:ribosomal protein S3
MGQKINPRGFRIGITEDQSSKWIAKQNDYKIKLREDYFLRQQILIELQKFGKFKDVKISKIELEERSYDFPTSKFQKTLKFDNSQSNFIENNVQKFERRILGSTLTTSTLRFEQVPNQITIKIYTPDIKVFHNSDLLLKTIATSINKKFQKYTSITTANKKYKSKPSILIRYRNSIKPEFDAKLIAEEIGSKIEAREKYRRAIKRAIQTAKRQDVKGIKIQIGGRLNGAEIARSEWVREGRVPLHTLNAKIDYYNHRAHTIYGILGIKVWVFKGFSTFDF